jgi:hypothetical protein
MSREQQEVVDKFQSSLMKHAGGLKENYDESIDILEAVPAREGSDLVWRP